MAANLRRWLTVDTGRFGFPPDGRSDEAVRERFLARVSAIRDRLGEVEVEPSDPDEVQEMFEARWRELGFRR